MMAEPCQGRSLLGRRADRHRHGGQEGLGRPCTRRSSGTEKKTGQLGGRDRYISMNEGCQGKSSKKANLARLGWRSRRSKAEDKLGKIER